MAGQLIPPPELAPSVPDNLRPEQYVELWVDLMNTCEQLLLAGLRREIGPDGDLMAAYQRWYNAQMEEHDRTMLRMMEEFDRRTRGDG